MEKRRRSQITLENMLSPHGRRVRYQKGEVVIHEGDSSEWLVYVLTGTMRLVSTSESGREFLFGEIGGKRLAGASYAISQSPYPYSMLAVEDCDVVKISRTVFINLVENNLRLSLALNQEVALEYNIMSRRLKSIVFYSIEERLLAYLKKRLEIENKIKKADKLTLRFSQEELSLVLGTTRESVSRALSSLKRKGVIEIEQKTLRFLTLPDEE